MRNPRRVSPLLSLFVIAMVALSASCSDKSTNPTGGGGATKELDSGTLPPGRVFTHTFNNIGTFNYSCTIHGSTMAGSVIVANGSNDSAFVTIGPGNTNTYSPTPVSVKPGGLVRWLNTNSPGADHTVTSP